ncbi:hypothetical protein [Sorangium atrum]|uniref:Secreted protein n=1 Tax=Sorangium atrum TaxID=2995308 RepID=A0ABT5CAC6_9BACT|nr:hypothetical protein [Sorangium aterium]MDC0683387.1 hypothetical protein [Sorangium aterium]
MYRRHRLLLCLMSCALSSAACVIEPIDQAGTEGSDTDPGPVLLEQSAGGVSTGGSGFPVCVAMGVPTPDLTFITESGPYCDHSDWLSSPAGATRYTVKFVPSPSSDPVNCNDTFRIVLRSVKSMSPSECATATGQLNIWKKGSSGCWYLASAIPKLGSYNDNNGLCGFVALYNAPADTPAIIASASASSSSGPMPLELISDWN